MIITETQRLDFLLQFLDIENDDDRTICCSKYALQHVLHPNNSEVFCRTGAKKNDFRQLIDLAIQRGQAE